MPDAAAEFDALADEFYEVWFRYHPDLIPAGGASAWVSLLPAQDDDELAALGGWLESLLLALDELDFGSLDPDRRLDYRLMAGAARVEHRDLLDPDLRHRDPLSVLPLAGIHRLTLEPSDDLHDPLVRLLAAVPEHLRQAQVQLRASVDRLAAPLVRAAALEAESGRCYLRELVRGPWLRRHCHGLAEIERLAEEACDGLADYRECLLGELAPRASGALGCGGGRLASRLADLHFLLVDPDVCRSVLDRALGRVASDLSLALAPAAPVPGGRPADAAARGACPSQASARELCEALQIEIGSSGVVTLPGARLRVGSRPACPGSRRLHADYWADADGGTLYPPSLSDSEIEDATEWLRAHCLAAGWGGSHLFAWSHPQRAGRTPRRLANGVSLVTGWGLYLERLLAELGPSRSHRRITALRRQREHLLLASLDLDLHVGRAAEAPRWLGALGLEGSAADGVLARLSLSPGDALAGALGWLLLESAREEARRDPDGQFSERQFHDRLVSQGPVPLALVLGQGFGDAFWQRVWDRAFAA